MYQGQVVIYAERHYISATLRVRSSLEGYGFLRGTIIGTRTRTLAYPSDLPVSFTNHPKQMTGLQMMPMFAIGIIITGSREVVMIIVTPLKAFTAEKSL